ncbi:MAG: hypothetical protein LKJ69_03740 [Lactobacillus sp.]|nr:hypothetical protein [Lactobacillus sp.]MCI2032493.1 hypothetical protein [Lactobacillus sp.]
MREPHIKPLIGLCFVLGSMAGQQLAPVAAATSTAAFTVRADAPTRPATTQPATRLPTAAFPKTGEARWQVVGWLVLVVVGEAWLLYRTRQKEADDSDEA